MTEDWDNPRPSTGAGQMTEMPTISNTQPAHTIQLTAPDGRRATIDFSTAEVTYSGDLPASEGAKVFFDALASHFHDAVMAVANDRIEALEKVLREIAGQNLSDEQDEETQDRADYQGGYDILIGLARKALAREQDKNTTETGL